MGLTAWFNQAKQKLLWLCAVLFVKVRKWYTKKNPAGAFRLQMVQHVEANNRCNPVTLSNWEKVLEHIDFPREQLKMTYTYKAHVYHVVYNRRELVSWPPYTTAEVQGPRGFPKTVLVACIYVEGKYYDVTAKVLEYAGPKQDFYKGKVDGVKVSAIFPDTALRKLVITDSWGGFSSFVYDDEIKW